MNCTHLKKYLQPYIDSTLGSRLSEQVAQHLNSCPNCAHEESSLRTLLSALQQTTAPHLSESDSKLLHDRVIASLPQTQRPSFRLFTSPAAQNRVVFFRPVAVAALLLIALFSASLLVPNLPHSQAMLSLFKNEQYPRVIVVQGAAFETEGASNVNSVAKNAPLLPGRGISTDSISTVAIAVDTKTMLNLSNSTKLSVKNYSRSRAVFLLGTGAVNAQVSKRTHEQLFRIETPNAFCEVIGTRFDVSAQKDPLTQTPVTTLVVHEGTVKFGTSKRDIFVKAGTAVAIIGDSLSSLVPENDPFINHLKTNPGKGRFSVVTEPLGAQVYIDNILYGITPMDAAISCGQHDIRLALPHYETKTAVIKIGIYDPVVLAATLSQVVTPSTSPKGSSLRNRDAASDAQPLVEAVSFMNSGRYTEAISRLFTLVNSNAISDSLKAVAYQKLSICYKNSGNLQSALQMLTTIINGNFPPTNKSTALFERGTLYRSSLHNSALAINDYSEYCSRYPNGIWIEESMLSLAELQQLSGLYAKAASTYLSFCNNHRSNPGYDKALFTLGTIYSSNLADAAKASKIYSRLLKENPASEFAEDALFWNADCLLKLGNVNTALGAYRMYLSRYPKGKWVSEATVRLHRVETAEAH